MVLSTLCEADIEHKLTPSFDAASTSERSRLQKLLRTQGPWDHDIGSLCDAHRTIDFTMAPDRVGVSSSTELGHVNSIFTTAFAVKCSLCRLLRFMLENDSGREKLARNDTWTVCSMMIVNCDHAEDHGYGYIASYNIESKYHALRQMILLGGHGEAFVKSVEQQNHNLLIHSLPRQVDVAERESSTQQSNRSLCGRRVPREVKTEQILEWLRICRERHGARCETTPKQTASAQLASSTRVIDVRRRVVVPFQIGVKFVALSYVWGSAQCQTFQSMRSNSMDEHGNYIETALPSELPITIEDAISLTKRLGFSFLWVDALCIVQDNVNHVREQISQMCIIYSSAVLTIANAGGNNAQDPIPGVRVGTRKPRQRVAIVRNSEITNVLPGAEHALKTTCWNSRGWTFQERVLSRRLLVFTRDQMYWQCVAEPWAEDLHAEQLECKSPNRLFNKVALVHEPVPRAVSENEAFRYYAYCVKTYTSRKLGKASDVLNAFAGVMRLLEGTSTLRFHHASGLPINMMECALLWHPILPVVPRQGVDLPSWCWASCEGQIEYEGACFRQHETKNSLRWCNEVTKHMGTSDILQISPEDSASNAPDSYTWLDGVLKFWTYAAFFRIKHVSTVLPEKSMSSRVSDSRNSTVRRALIVDREGVHAGEIIIDYADPDCQEDEHEFIVCCQARTSKRHVWTQGWCGNSNEQHYFHGIPDPQGHFPSNTVQKPANRPWSYLSVMMISRKDGIDRRLAVGTVSEDAWKVQPSRFEQISLH